jgi:plastocyanin
MKMTRSSWGCALTLSLALLAADANLHADAATSRQTVVLENMQFTPAIITVHRGDTVVWVNRDLVPHTATGSAFDSKAIAPSASWSFTPTKAGRFDYVCTFHPTMKATVVVE